MRARGISIRHYFVLSVDRKWGHTYHMFPSTQGDARILFVLQGHSAMLFCRFPHHFVGVSYTTMVTRSLPYVRCIHLFNFHRYLGHERATFPAFGMQFRHFYPHLLGRSFQRPRVVKIPQPTFPPKRVATILVRPNWGLVQPFLSQLCSVRGRSFPWAVSG